MLRKPVEYAERIVHAAGQDKVPHDHPALHHVVLDLRRADLPVHFLDGRCGDLRIIRRGGERFRQRGIGIFHVRQIDVDESFQLAQRLHALIAAAVVDDRDGQLRRQGRENGRQEMRWRDEFDVLCAVVDQPFERLAQRGRGEQLSKILMRNLIVLTIEAAERTA